MDMSTPDSSTPMSMSTSMVFTNSHTTPLYSTNWTPSSPSAYAGTCIFLVLLGIIFRGLWAYRTTLEARWAVRARNRRYVLVKGQQTEAARIDADPDAKTGSLVTVNGVEEKVKVVQAAPKTETEPFRLSVDVPRAMLLMLISGVGYLLMLAVMTMNVGYFMSVLAGTFVGELVVGRYAAGHAEDH